MIKRIAEYLGVPTSEITCAEEEKRNLLLISERSPVIKMLWTLSPK